MVEDSALVDTNADFIVQLDLSPVLAAILSELVDHLRTAPDPRLGQILNQLEHLQKEVTTMGDTISQQIDTATANIAAKLTSISTDTIAISAEITDLRAQVAAATPPVGSVVTQDQADKLAAVAASLGDATAKLDAIAAVAAPAPAA